MKLFWAISLFLFVSTGFAQADMNETIRQINSLTKENKFGEALEVVEKALDENRDPSLLQVKFTLLAASGRHKEALETALEQDKIAVKKLPWKCLDIACAYLALNKKDKALDWLEEAVNRGFTKYQVFSYPTFDALRDMERFQRLVIRVEGFHGIGKPAKNFTVKVLSGDSFTLSSQKGRVVLIDFWATWCAPCLREIPRMKKIYSTYRDKGFEIISINLDRRKEDVVKFIQEKELDWKVSCSGALWSDPTALLYGVNKIPSTWLVDKEGIVRKIDLSGEALEKAIVDLI